MLYRKTRVITIIPSKKWENSDSLLGALVRYEEYASAHERVLRISEVYPNSPALVSGIQPRVDYILGTPQYLYTDLSELANFIEMTQEKDTVKSLELYIYSSQTNSVRSTFIFPNRNWGGQGLLGCEFGLGILNYLPQLDDNILVSALSENLDPIQNAEENKVEENLPLKSIENTPQTIARPPTDSEIHHHQNSHELTNDRIKLLHLSHQHPPQTKTTIKSGRSAANPFHHPKENNNDVNDPTNESQRKKTLDLTADGEFLNLPPQSSKSMTDLQNQEQNNPSLTQNQPKTLGDISSVPRPIRKGSQDIKIKTSPEKPKPTCKTSIEYSFFSKKLNRDYKIISTNLFDLDELNHLLPK